MTQNAQFILIGPIQNFLRYSRDDVKTYMYRFMYTFSPALHPDWSEGAHGEDISALFGIKMNEVYISISDSLSSLVPYLSTVKQGR